MPFLLELRYQFFKHLIFHVTFIIIIIIIIMSRDMNLQVYRHIMPELKSVIVLELGLSSDMMWCFSCILCSHFPGRTDITHKKFQVLETFTM